jgi:hypothetical protein
VGLCAVWDGPIDIGTLDDSVLEPRNHAGWNPVDVDVHLVAHARLDGMFE